MKNDTNKTTTSSSAKKTPAKKCILPGINDKPATKKPGKIQKLVRKVKKALNIKQNVRVRYDGEAKKWAILNADNSPIEHVNSGTLTDVKFDSYSVSEPPVGCSPSNKRHIGVASGDLKVEDLGEDHIGYKNLKFENGMFADFNGYPIHSAKSVLLLPNRRAMYQEA